MSWVLNKGVDSGGTKAWNCYAALLGNVVAMGFAADITDVIIWATLALQDSAPHQALNTPLR